MSDDGYDGYDPDEWIYDHWWDCDLSDLTTRELSDWNEVFWDDWQEALYNLEADERIIEQYLMALDWVLLIARPDQWGVDLKFILKHLPRVGTWQEKDEKKVKDRAKRIASIGDELGRRVAL